MVLSLARYVAFFVLATYLLIPSTTSAETLMLDDSTTAVDVGTYIKYVEDAGLEYSFEEVQSPSFQQNFVDAEGNISKGYTKSAYWIRLDLYYEQKPEQETVFSNTNYQGFDSINRNELIPSNTWLLDIGYPLLDSVDIYFKKEVGGITHVSQGDHKQFDHRSVPVISLLTPFEMSPYEKITVFIRVETTSSMRVPITVRSAKNAIVFYQNFQIAYGVYFGIIASFFLYNLFMYLFFMDRSYLYYLGYIASFALALSTIIGFGNVYLWPKAMWLTDYFIVESIALYCLFSLLFAQSFLHTKRHLPDLHRWISVAIAISFIVLLVNPFLPYQVAVKFVAILTMLANILILSAGITSLLIGVKVAKYFVLAWTTVLIGGGLFALMSTGIIPANAFTYYSVQIGSAIEVILLSIALADRMHRLEQEKNDLERESKNALERANSELSSALDNVQKSNRLKDEFLATISHELRTPMNGVEGAIELALDEKSPQKSLELLEVAASSAKQMTNLVDSILEYSEIQADKTLIDSGDVDVRKLTIALATSFSKKCKGKRVIVTYDIGGEVPSIIRADHRALTVVLGHVLDNAIKFTPEGTVHLHVLLRSNRSAGFGVDKRDVVFVVTDTGIGIPEEKAKDIFTPFNQADSSFARGYGGLGIGLAICKALAIKMSGDLFFTSPESGGSQFTLSIPCEAAPPVVERERDVAVSASVVEGIVEGAVEEVDNSLPILVVEDNPVNQKILVGILKKLGHPSITAENGVEALALLKNQMVKLIFMDCQMPEMDGFEATKRIRQSDMPYKNLPIIAVTANAMSEDKLKCLNAGMNDYIKKPISRAIISSKLDEWKP